MARVVEVETEAPARKGWLFVTALVLITILGPLAIHMYIPIMPYVQRAYGTTVVMAQFTLSIVMFTMAIGTLFYGSLADRHGRRPVVLGGLVLFGIGSVVCAFAPDIPTMIVGRLIQALGAGCGFVLARAIARDVYGSEKLSQVIAYITTAYVLGPMLAPALGGFLADIWGWQAVFIIAVLTGGVILVLAFAVLGETHTPVRAEGRRFQVVEEYRRLLKMPMFVGYAINPAFTSGAFFAVATSSSFIMSDIYHRPAAEHGLYFILLPIGYMAGNFASGWIGGRIKTATMVVTGNLMAIATCLLLAVVLLLDPATPAWIFIAGSLLACGQGLSMPFAQAAAINAVPQLVGTASGITVFLHFMGMAVASQLTGLFYNGTVYPMLIVATGASVLSLLSGLYANAHARRAAAAGLAPLS